MALVSEGTLVGSTWTIPNVTSTHSATVTFTINSYTVTASVSGDPSGGSVTPSNRTVNHGDSATFTVTTNAGYTVLVSEGTSGGYHMDDSECDLNAYSNSHFYNQHLYHYCDVRLWGDGYTGFYSSGKLWG